jgi:pimeloyl-ACP methyl ester carboxylesterase
MTRKKAKLQNAVRKTASANSPAEAAAGAAPIPPTISGRWLLAAIAGVIPAAALCVWCALCLLFWQGSWQLLYHPAAPIASTPASAGLPFVPIGFATTGSGTPRLTGWWIPAAAGAPFSRYTVLYLHSQDGNLGNTVDQLAQLHAAGPNVFAFDYRGYGQSRFAHPSEANWLEDASWALEYLTATRHIDPGAIVLVGSNLGANLALEFAAAHPELAGIVLEFPLDDPAGVIFADSRARLVPAHLLVHDRYDLATPAADLRIPSLWYLPFPHAQGKDSLPSNPEAFEKVSAPKIYVWLPASESTTRNFADEISRWLSQLPAR